MWHDSCDMTHVTWLRWHDSCDMTHVTWLIRNMTQLFLTAQTRSSFCVTCRIYMWHDSCDITYVILLSDMTHRWHDSAVLDCANARFVMCDMPYLYVTWLIHVRKNHGITHMNESCYPYEWVVSHIWMSHVTHMSRVTHMNESCHTWMNEWFMSHILIKRTPLPPGGFPIYYVPSSGTRE